MHTYLNRQISRQERYKKSQLFIYLMKIKKRTLQIVFGIAFVAVVIILLMTRTQPYDDPGKMRASSGTGDIKLVVFSDYQCPACAKAYFVVEQIAEEYNDKIKVTHKHYPLNFHPLSFDAAMAAECANDQDKFWDYSAEIFLMQDDLKKSSFNAVAKDLGLDMKLFRSCLSTDAKSDMIYKDMAEGDRLGILGTPTIYLDGKSVESWEYEYLSQQIEKLYKENNIESD
ncbi:hypothetical protein COV93_05715 [Candidatus Woesearchaeota archaeon CG11_big_fil_rev_8_21_14_0_20_43_8]|nr:MAG: hypothetical protein COV93_05715 [Candidatus Woesearchaeota archaeon CG11_big_fil_rev_8_21_14_0_20_43_8]